MDLQAVVDTREVTNPFMVTEVYSKENGKWKLPNSRFRICSGRLKRIAIRINHEHPKDGGFRMMRRIDDFLRIAFMVLQTPYPADYHTTVQQVVRENETGYLPPLKTVIDGPDQYDVVFVGFPTWDMKLPPPMKSFLHQYSFRGKTIIPFNSNGGYGPGSTFQTVRELCPQSTVLQGFSTRGGLERDGQLLAVKDA